MDFLFCMVYFLTHFYSEEFFSVKYFYLLLGFFEIHISLIINILRLY